MKISIIVAKSENNVIGRNGQLPWRLSDDLKLFKSTTSGHHILMGRKTFESIGRPLPNRTNLIISTNPNYSVKGCPTFTSIEQGIQFAKGNGENELFIIGGGNIYQQVMPLVNRVYLTQVNAEIEGDTFLENFDLNAWELAEKKSFQANKKNDFDFDFLILDRP